VSADFKQTCIALIAPTRCFHAAPLWFTAKLIIADEGESGAQPLVLDNRSLVGLVVTSVPKVTLRKANYFKALCHAF
jgi:hypothetical protein